MHDWSTRLRRVTTSGTFVPEIDGLRFVAIASVVVYHVFKQLIRYYGVHFSPMLTTLLGNGNRGVSLFFVISGFVLALPFASYWLQGSASVDLKRYFGRRLTRLEPPYVLNLLICAALLIVVNHVSTFALLPHLLSSLFYSHNLIYGNMSTVNVVTWSLEVEVQFYLIMPLLAFVFAIQFVWVRRGVLVAAMLIVGQLQTHWNYARAQLSILYYIQFFLAGLILADLYLQRKHEDKKWGWDILSVVGWPIVFTLTDLCSQIVLPFVVLALYWAAFHGRLTNRLFRLQILTIIGGMCYTIYLFHFLIIVFATHMLGRAKAPLLVVMVSLALIAIASIGYFLLVERPCMDRNWPRKLGVLFSRLRTQSVSRNQEALLTKVD